MHSQWYWAAHRLMADGWKTCSARRTARSFVSGDGDETRSAFLYFFSHVPSWAAGTGQGAYHSS